MTLSLSLEQMIQLNPKVPHCHHICTISAEVYYAFLDGLVELRIVAKLSRTFQLDDYLIIKMNDHIEYAAIHLTQLKQGTGKYCTQFSEKFNGKG